MNNVTTEIRMITGDVAQIVKKHFLGGIALAQVLQHAQLNAGTAIELETKFVMTEQMMGSAANQAAEV